MIEVIDLSLILPSKTLFKDVNLKFTDQNCYGLIGANGAGKSTFLKILSGETESTSGVVKMNPGERLSFLKQDHFAYDNELVQDVVLMGNQELYEVFDEKNKLYMKTDFSEEDGLRAAELENRYAELGGWESESQISILLDGLGLDPSIAYKRMNELENAERVKVLLAQAIFDNPDVLLLDEPTNHLDVEAINWLVEFLIEFENTVIVVSHDRHFLNQVCTHIADIDFGEINLFAGNYDFWYESSQLIQKQMKDSNRKKEEKIKELEEFIARFSANASKSKQATSRKKSLEKIELEDIKPSSRRYPYIAFKPEREIGNDCFVADALTVSDKNTSDILIDKQYFRVEREDKVFLLSDNKKASSKLLEVMAGQADPDSGELNWGLTTKVAYFPTDYNHLFDTDDTILSWLWDYTDSRDEAFVRGFLGRMLFAADELQKPVKVLSGGEKVRLVLSSLMIQDPNVLLLDDPVNHLDMESVQALNDGLINFKGVVVFTSNDHQFIETISNKICHIDKSGQVKMHLMGYEEFLEKHKDIMKNQVYVKDQDE